MISHAFANAEFGYRAVSESSPLLLEDGDGRAQVSEERQPVSVL